MLARKIERKISDWIKNEKSALLIDGARQVGKTFIIRKCLKDNKVDFAEFNLLDRPEIVSLLERTNDVDELVTNLSLFTDKKFVKGQTVIFLDEIQEFKEIVTKIKFLVEDGSFRYVLSGSLLGVELKNIRSAPIGYLTAYTMYPLDFEEFLQIYNFGDALKKSLYKSFIDKTPVEDAVHEKMMKIFNLYLIVGGMPAAAEKFRQTRELEDVMRVHSDIVRQYKLDFTKYEKIEKRLFLTKIYELIPSSLSEKNKRFNYSDVKKGLRFERSQDDFLWLSKAGVALPVFNASQPKLPLKANEKSSLFKLFMADVGILTSLYGRATVLNLLNADGSVNGGAIYENVVAQELRAHGYDLYYYNSKKYGELDFVIEYGEKILPIEVKSGKDYSRHTALDNVMKVPEYGIDEAVVFSNYNVRTENKVVYYPVYFVMFFEQTNVKLPKIDLGGF